jgi:glutaconate CoA-transferase subunit A
VRRRRPNRSDDIDHLIAASARAVIVSVEEVDDAGQTAARRDETLIPGNYITAVVHAPGGAYPTGCDAFYDPDIAHLAAYAQASRSPEGMSEYIGRYVDGVSPDRFRELTAGAEAR